MLRQIRAGWLTEWSRNIESVSCACCFLSTMFAARSYPSSTPAISCSPVDLPAHIYHQSALNEKARKKVSLVKCEMRHSFVLDVFSEFSLQGFPYYGPFIIGDAVEN